MTTVQAARSRSSSSASSSSRLQQGSSGAAVKELQNLLKSLGLYTANADGKFGPVTDAAVRKFQKKYGLTVDGWAGPQTMAKLRAVASAPKPAAPKPPAASTPPAAAGGKMVLGSSGPEVKELQLRLKAQGYYNGNIGGNFGPGTEAAVKAFQRANRLTVDGWAGPQTMAKLRGTTSTTPTSPTAPTAPVNGGGRVQSAIQWGLTQLGAPYVGGASPFRFGTQPGNGKTYQMAGQRAYVSPAGVIGYDCSGFVTAMFRKVGVDLAASPGASSSAMKAGLPSVPKNALQPGDLLVKNGHVVMYIGDGKVLQSSPSGVNVASASTFINDPSYSGHRVPLP